MSSPQGQGPARDGGLARIGFVLVHARGGGRAPARALRERRAGLLCRRAVGGQRIRALSRRPRPPRAPYRDRDRARSRLRRGRGQEGLQRGDRLYAGRLANRRPGPGLEEFLAQRRPFVRRHGGWRRRLAACRMDRRRRADDRHAGRRSAPLRPLRRHRLPHREERGGLRQGLHRALSRRRARRRPPAAPDALLCADEGSRRGVRLRLRLGAAELVRAEGLRLKRGRPRQARRALERESSARGRRREAAREMELPPFELFRLRRRRMPQRPRQRRPPGHVGVRQARGFRPRRRKLARFHPHATASRRRSAGSRSPIS